ncbi:hypothetical protein ABT160_22545 [Streptomyces sp. NPDC001941]|uniref:hypothetical protein n=1 Tax=Streptomyces sp. NPDC001941 TaxID=3154659 RepID=UPI0033271721
MIRIRRSTAALLLTAACAATATPALAAGAPAGKASDAPSIRTDAFLAQPANTFRIAYSCAPGTATEIWAVAVGHGHVAQQTLGVHDAPPVCDGTEQTAELRVTEFPPGFEPFHPGDTAEVKVSLYGPDAADGDDYLARHETTLTAQ